MQLTHDDATLVLFALGCAVSYVLEERRPADRRASQARAERFRELRDRLLREVAAAELRESEPEGPDDARAYPTTI